MDHNIYSRFSFRILKPTLVSITILYMLFQVMITIYSSDTHYTGHLYRRLSIGRQVMQDNATNATVVTKAFDNSTSEMLDNSTSEMLDNSTQEADYLKRTREIRVPDKPVPNTCSSSVNLLRGHPRSTRGFLTIGLSTVPREHVFYLPHTLTSLISKMTHTEKNESVIVIYLGSHNQTWINTTLTMIDRMFAGDLSTGLIHVIQPHANIYPDFSTITKRTYNDSMDRVLWRTKQNIDYAYLFAYCKTLSEYYIHIEDDITAATGYIQYIKEFITNTNKSKHTWFVLEFSTLGFIGKLFRSSDLCTMKKYLILFQEMQPCDMLLSHLTRIMTQTRVFKIQRSLFQHNGLKSSLNGKVQKLTDKHFRDINTLPSREMLTKKHADLSTFYTSLRFPNPPARVYTSMEINGGFTPDRPYDVRKSGFFWAISPTIGSYYRIILDHPINITVIHIQTGHPKYATDILQNGTVKLGIKSRNRLVCTNTTTIGLFKKGQFYKTIDKHVLATCLELVVTQSQQTWMILSDIQIGYSSQNAKEVINTSIDVMGVENREVVNKGFEQIVMKEEAKE